MTSPIDTAYVAIEPDFSGFAREVDSELLAPLQMIDRSLQEVIHTLENEFAELGRTISEDISHAVTSVNSSFDSMKRNAISDMDTMDRHAETTSSGIGSKFSKITGMLTIGFGAAAAGMGLLAKQGLTSAGSLEQVNIAFDSLTGSVTKGNAQFKQLQQFAAVTPFRFTDLTTSAQRFDAFSKSIGQTQQQLVPFLTTIGDLVSETGGGAQALDTITLAMGQTASQGKLTLGNLDQINNAIPGFNSVAAIAAVRGETAAQVMSEISKGTIDANTGLNQLLVGMQRFPGAAGAMQKQSETLLGVFSTFQDTMSQSLSNAFAPAIPLIKNSLVQITPIIGKALDTVGPALGQLIAQILPLLGNLVAALVPLVTPVLQALGAAAKILAPALLPLGNAIGLIFKALEPLVPVLAQVVVAFAQALAPVIAALAPVIVDLVGPLSDILLALTPLIPPLGQLLVAAVQLAEPFIKLTAVVLKFLTAKALVPIVQLLVPLLSGLASAIGTVAKWINKINWGQVGDAIVDFAKKVGGFFVGLWDSIASFFTSLPDKVMSWLSRLPGVLLDAATTAMHAFLYAIGFGIGLIVKEFINLPGQIWSLIRLLWQGAVDLFTQWIPKLIEWVAKLQRDFLHWVGQMWTKAKERFLKGVDDLVDFVRKLPGRVVAEVEKLPGQIWNAVKGAANWLYNTGRDIIHGLIKGIESMIGSAIDTITGAMKDIWNGAKDALGITSPSKLFMEIGHNVVMGYNQGVTQHAPSAALTTAQALTPSSNLLGGVQGGGAGITFGPGAIVIQFAGVVPTEQEALQTGAAVGRGITNTLAQARIRNTVRTI